VKETPVVWLNSGLNTEDHGDFPIEQVEGVYSMERLMIPRHNLEVQTKVISRARAFFGTYGGLSYLAPFYGVPSVAFYSDEQSVRPAHIDVARRAFRDLGTSFIPLHVRDVDLLRPIFARAVRKTPAADGSAIPEVW